MTYFRRNPRLLFLIALAIIMFVFVFFVRPFLPFALAALVTLWSQVDIRDGIIIALVSAALIGIFTLIHKAFGKFFKKLIASDSTRIESKLTSDEQIYLETFITRITEGFERESPWDVKKYTDLEAVLKEQDQHARIVQARLWRLPGTETTSTEVNLGARVDMQTFLRSEKRPIMIKGEPGTGKTLTILRFAVDQARRAKNSEPGKERLPIYIRLSAYTGRIADGNPEPVLDFIQRYLHQEYPEAGAIADNLDNLKKYLLNKRLVLLFDGLNELPPDEYLARSQNLEDFISNYPTTKFIFTCRTPRYTPESKFVTVEISDLDNAQIRRFIEAYRGEKAAETLYRDLTTGDGFMLRICRNPFMLRMLVTRNSGRPIPETPAQLFDEYVHDQLATVSQHAQQTADVLRSMAFAMQEGGHFAGAVDYDTLRMQLPGVDLDEHLQIAQKINLLNYTSKTDIRFYHQILQEYFAATALKQVWQQSKNVSQYFSNYRWEDTILVCTGLIDNMDAEKFIRDIWSPGQNDPEHFWLATKAVGSCGGRVSSDYYDAVINTATKYLMNRETTSTLGYSRTMLAVGTVKALSYIDDEGTARLLSDTLTNVDGWVQELCIQVLGRSRQDYAHHLLRDAMVKRHSLSALMLVAPYFNRTEWLAMVANSTLTSGRLINWFWGMTRMLWILAPGVYLGLLVIGSQIFKTDPFVLLGRVVALSMFMQLLVEYVRGTIKILRTQKIVQAKLRQFKDLLLSEWIIIILIIAFWFFPNETLTLSGLIVNIIFYVLIITLAFTLLLTVFNPRHLVLILYSWASRSMIFTVGIIVAGLGSLFLLPSVWHTPANFHLVISPVAIFLSRIGQFLIYSPVAYIIIALATLIGTASIVVHLITYGKYWRIRQYCKAFNRKGDVQAAQTIVRMALKPSAWLHVRDRAIKSLNLIRLSIRDINTLDVLLDSDELHQTESDSWLQSLRSYFENQVNLRRDLERAVSELIERAREEERETPDELLLSMLINRATTRYQEEYFHEALTFVNQVITLDGKNAEALFLRGRIYLSLNNYDQALADLSQALLHPPQDGLIMAYRGFAYYKKLNFEQALADFDQSIALGQKESWIFSYRGDIRLLWGFYSEALADFNQALKENTDDSWLLIKRGSTLRQLGQYPEALTDFDRVLSKDVNDSSALLERGIAYRQMGKYPDALTDISHSIAISDHDDWSYYQQALVYMLQHQQDLFEESICQAIHYIQEAAGSGQNTPESHPNLALYKLVHGENAEAQTQYEQLQINYSEATSLRIAIEDLRDFLTVSPDQQLAHQMHDQLQARVNELSKAPAAR